MIVCYSVNDNYYDLFEVSLRSLLDFNEVKKIYVLNSNLSEKCILSAKKICKSNCDMEFIQIDVDMFRDIEMNYFGVETFYRLLLPELINDDKVWYIDVDTIILGSIEEPFYQELSHMVSAVPKPFQENLEIRKNKLNMSKNSHYFNAGVLLLNLKKIRNNNFFKEVLEWININLNIIDMPDQDALNAMLNDNYHKLDVRYNVTTEIAKKIKNPIIVHFTGEFKPNLFFYQHPYRSTFMKYFNYNKESFNIVINLRFLKHSIKNLLLRVGSKIPFLKKIYRKFKPKKI